MKTNWLSMLGIGSLRVITTVCSSGASTLSKYSV